MRRVELPPGGSILMTSAPSPASVSPQYSACSSASSITRMPVSTPRRGAAVLGAERSCCGFMLTPIIGAETAAGGADNELNPVKFQASRHRWNKRDAASYVGGKLASRV